MGGFGAFFLLLDEPEVYGLPPDPVDATRDLGALWRRGLGAAARPALAARRWPASVLGSRAVSAAPSTRSYYGRPVIKAPVWTPEIPFVPLRGRPGRRLGGAGLGGRAAPAPTSWPGGPGWCRRPASAVSPALLVSDLGRPRRFLNMLRVFKVTSPMSVGSWMLDRDRPAAVAGRALRRGHGPRSRGSGRRGPAGGARPARAYRSPPTPARCWPTPRCPVWHEARAELPFVFAAGAAASAGAALTALTPPEHAGPARRLAVLGSAAEIGADRVMQRRLGDTGRALPPGARRGG